MEDSLIDGEWDLTPKEIIDIFKFKGWRYATKPYGYGIPSEEQIQRVYEDLYKVITESEDDVALATRARFLAIRQDPESLCVNLYLNVGYIWNPELDEEDE